MSGNRMYVGFLGTWTLDPSSCLYEQGLAPQSSTYRIEDRDGVLFFLIDWIDAEGSHERVDFSGIPDGSKTAFAGAPFADSMSIDAASENDLISTAYWQSETRMIATRTLIAEGKIMRVVQSVQLPDGNKLVNHSSYTKNALA